MQLLEYDATTSYGSYIEKFWNDMYLCGRWPVPINNNAFLNLSNPNVTSNPTNRDQQTQIAASALHGILRFGEKCRQGKLQPSDPPRCLYQHSLQAGTGRVARKQRDEWRFAPDSEHVVVLFKNHFYKLVVRNKHTGKLASVGQLQRMLNSIVADTADKPDALPVGALTSMERDAWASLREQLETIPANREILEAIDTAQFVLCLDDQPPLSANELSARLLHGNGHHNRWFDKHNLICFPSGHVGINFEHSFSDGLAWNDMIADAWKGSVLGSDPAALPPTEEVIALQMPQPLNWELTTYMQQQVYRAAEEHVKAADRVACHVAAFEDFGSNKIKGWKVSPDAVVQLALQMAYKAVHGTQPCVYESCATTKFFHGRTETIRSASLDIFHAVNAALSKFTNHSALPELIRAAASTHTKLAKEAANGLGVDRHFLAMQQLAKDMPSSTGKEAQRLFEHPVFRRSSHWDLSTSNLSAPTNTLFGFGPVVQDGYGTGYLIGKDSITVNITNFTDKTATDGAEFEKQFRKSLETICMIMQNGG